MTVSNGWARLAKSYDQSGRLYKTLLCQVEKDEGAATPVYVTPLVALQICWWGQYAIQRLPFQIPILNDNLNTEGFVKLGCPLLPEIIPGSRIEPFKSPYPWVGTSCADPNFRPLVQGRHGGAR
eukprot:CAMPEP_0177642508 /NCGR_PEP_ID=MMETSP0447-20121125/7624_1 /TAXON_ID=0 /ORGANISM="Stygamoeba regulata, Strain BSH-02190019" /LENGTH=123 /DNA_ID=CAMNT_0019144671 /DNA_START=751 /DNA_END=1122 /DNA_ORIENTATION=+